MNPETAAGYPPRSRCSHIRHEVYCSPQLDHTRYMGGDAATPWAVYAEGLHDTKKLMPRARFPRAAINEFRDLVDRLAATPPA